MLMKISQNKTPKKAPAQINNSLKTGLEFLLRLAVSDKPIVLTEVARELNMDYTRVNRLFGTLAAMGFAERTTDRRYIAGPGIHLIATLGLHKSHLLGISVPHLYSLSARLNMVVALGVLWGTHVCYIFHGDTNTSFSEAIDNPMLYEAEKSSIGLAMLAEMSNDEIADLYSHFNEQELIELLDKIETVRTQGFAYGGIKSASMAVSFGKPCIAGLAIAPQGKPFMESVLLQELHSTSEKIYHDLNNKKNLPPLKKHSIKMPFQDL